MIDGYTVTHSADDILDSKGQPTQTFMGVSLITSPRLKPCILDIVAINGRFLSFKIDTAEAPLTVQVVYMPPHNQREQDIRDKFWQDLGDTLHSHTANQPILLVGDFNAQLLDELASNTGSVGPHAHFGAQVADEQ